ncbi:hypothetical protein AAZX31_08G182600 [Glycine max]|uniref:Basic blue protein n=1 Tax=Glycine max TaxID=3847 RepID=I1KUK0_SOYBN|nr:hypothetical protein JHK85_022207 [Glycine max]KAG5137014.1 hypothetical protein JHK82_021745 [Glycine max]KAH1051882.1 hypothetical protein GYH30_021663 [Glycine max]KHN26693.1 Basic blue protein [Glycine soja]KRH44003.1 hypothetical protein GLYMA_08G184800v4 [Glycine max]
MAQGRGILLLLCMLVLYSVSEMAHAKTYMVGGEFGWNYTVNMTTWPNGKSFRTGDILVFYYITYDNVVIVDEAGYNSCRAPKGSITYRSGNDHIALARGPNYFICTNQDHCSLNGMKIAVNAI